MNSTIDLTRGRLFKGKLDRDGWEANMTDWDDLVGNRPKGWILAVRETPFTEVFAPWRKYQSVEFPEVSSALGINPKDPYDECIHGNGKCDCCGRPLRFYDSRFLCNDCVEAPFDVAKDLFKEAVSNV